ncbi:hypothetical protein WR25_12148 [Diploscapter pachys]|uniref:Uncharacterized protein n=1 Tax=Diploscapter pachys TaxID=2018661 RepID=A0A2A2LE49_9BILA|nr:hypothetical protein WR25_12148 [Diploscapter pachys]
MLAACSSSYRREDDPVSAASDAVPPHSLSDGCLDPEPHEMNGEKRKRRRRRGKHRFLPYHARTSDDKQLDDANNDNDRRRSLRSAAPMAPSNTTQFLLEDREARVEAEKDEVEPAELRRSARLRSLSVSSDHFPFNSSDYGSTSGESVRQLFVFREISINELQEIEREFETEFEEFKRDKLNEMSKQEIVDQLLEREKDADLLAGECAKYVTENRQLKELLTSHGITYNTRSAAARISSEAQPTSQPVK